MGLVAVDLPNLCAEIAARGSRGGASYGKLLPRLFRATAAELRKRGWEPNELLGTTPDDPVVETSGKKQGDERRRRIVQPELELDQLDSIIAERRTRGLSVDWHVERRAQISEYLAFSVEGERVSAAAPECFRAQYVGPSHALRSAVAAAAYRAGERLVDECEDIVHDYTERTVAYAEILAPDGSPSWVYDRGKLWNTCEHARNHVRGVTARELRIALPRELHREAQVALVRSFLREECVARGMVVDWTLHDGPRRNTPHVHVLLTTRALIDDGFGLKVRAWDQKKVFFRWLEQWVVYVNRALELAGHAPWEAEVGPRRGKGRSDSVAASPRQGLRVSGSKSEARSACKGAG